MHAGQRGRLGEGRHRAAAVAHLKLAGAGPAGQLAAAQAVAPDAVVAGQGQVHFVVGREHSLRLVQGDVARRGHDAFDRLPGAAVAADRVDPATAQHDPAQGMVAGVGHVQHVADQGQPVRAPERRMFQVAIDEVGGAHAELAQHAPGMVAFEDPVMAAVGHVQAILGRDNAAGKKQWQARFGAGFHERAQILVIRHRQRIAQRRQRSFQFGHRIQAGHPFADLAVGVDQQHRRPGLDAEALPGLPVDVMQDREGHALPAQLFQHVLRIALAVEARHVHGQRLQASRITGVQLGHVAQPLPRPGRGRIDEDQRHHPSTLLMQRAGGSVEPLQVAGEFGGGISAHRSPDYAGVSLRTQSGHNRLCRRIDQSPSLFEFRGTAGIGIGNGAIAFDTGPFHQQGDLVACGFWCLVDHIAQVFTIGAQQPVELKEILPAQLARAEHGNIHAMPARAGDAARIRRLAGMPARRSR